MNWPDSSSKKEAMLGTLCKDEGDLIYKRIRLAAEILQDNAYIDDNFRGDTVTAVIHLEEKYFTVISEAFSLAELIEAYHVLPESEWKSLRYKLKAVVLSYRHKLSEQRAEDDAKARKAAEKRAARELKPKSTRQPALEDGMQPVSEGYLGIKQECFESLRTYIKCYESVLGADVLLILRGVLEKLESEACEGVA